MKAIVNGRVYYNECFNDDLVVIYDDKIKDVINKDEYALNYKQLVSEEIDAKRNYVTPGLIDVHIHGYDGVDTMDGDIQSITKMQKSIVANGVTSFLPTTVTMDTETLKKALDTVKAKMYKKENNCARVIGAHLEGPYINIQYKGAQNGDFIVKPSTELLSQYSDVIKIVTIAPEIEGSIELIEEFKDKINFSIGHTNATYEEATKAVKCGAVGLTHTFNAMTPLTHRKLGVVGCGMYNDNVYTELIADNVHTHGDLHKILLKVKGIDKVLLITDSIMATNLGDGDYKLGGLKIIVKGNMSLLENGSIAGSTLKLNDGLRNFTKNTGESLENTIKTVTINQAKYLKLDDKIGTLDVGKFADIVILDETLNVKMTIVEGCVAYENEL